jgi:hypothetical protein
MTPLEQAAADYDAAVKTRDHAFKVSALANEKADEFRDAAGKAARAVDVARQNLLDTAQQLNPNQ